MVADMASLSEVNDVTRVEGQMNAGKVALSEFDDIRGTEGTSMSYPSSTLSRSLTHLLDEDDEDDDDDDDDDDNDNESDLYAITNFS